MSGTLTLGGMADGLLIGELILGPSSMNGKRALGSVHEVELTAKVEASYKVPSEAVAACMVFTFTTGPAEVKLGTNLTSAATGFPIPALGFAAFPILSTVTELKFKAETAPGVFQLAFI